jgi:TPR repeat protein
MKNHFGIPACLLTLFLFSCVTQPKAPLGDGLQSYIDGKYTFAFNVFMREAESGDPDAMYYISRMYDHGEGVSRDYSIGEKWLRKAADAGSADAIAYLGWAYLNPDHLRDGVELRYEKQDLLTHRVKSPFKASYEEGKKYLEGSGVPQDIIIAKYHLLITAYQGDIRSQYLLGRIYEGDYDSSPYLPEALKWYKTAVSRNSIEAEYRLAQLYEEGRGVAKDHETAAYFYREAAEQNYSAALMRLGFFYETGVLGKRDNVLAYTFYSLSMSAGEDAASSDLSRVAPLLSKVQIDEAKNLASHWKVNAPLPTKSASGT